MHRIGRDPDPSRVVPRYLISAHHIASYESCKWQPSPTDIKIITLFMAGLTKNMPHKSRQCHNRKYVLSLSENKDIHHHRSLDAMRNRNRLTITAIASPKHDWPKFFREIVHVHR